MDFYSISDTHSNVKSLLIEILSYRFHWIPALIRSFIFPLLWPCYVYAFKLQMSAIIYCRQTIKTNPEQKSLQNLNSSFQRNECNSWRVVSLLLLQISYISLFSLFDITEFINVVKCICGKIPRKWFPGILIMISFIVWNKASGHNMKKCSCIMQSIKCHITLKVNYTLLIWSLFMICFLWWDEITLT